MSAPEFGTVLHIVCGESGHYSDYRTWVVAAYMEREKAEEHMRLANEWEDERWRRIAEIDNNPNDTRDSYDVRNEQNAFDSISGTWDRSKYSVSLLNVHLSPQTFAMTEMVLTDYAKEQGWIPS